MEIIVISHCDAGISYTPAVPAAADNALPHFLILISFIRSFILLYGFGYSYIVAQERP